MGGHVQFMFDGPATSVPMIKSGKLKAFAVTTPQRLGTLPDVPTFEELGYPAMTTVAWVGLWVTPDVPAPVQAKLRELALKAMQSPASTRASRRWAWSPASTRRARTWPRRFGPPTSARAPCSSRSTSSLSNGAPGGGGTSAALREGRSRLGAALHRLRRAITVGASS